MPKKKTNTLDIETQFYQGRKNCSDPFSTVATASKVADEQYKKGLRDGRKIVKRKKVKNG